MAAGPQWLCSTLLFVVFVSADLKFITTQSGQNITLTCRAPNNNITTLKWSRADLGDKNVLLHRDGQSVPDDQHPSFKNRVDLQDRQMKDGKVSLILKDVTINDAGTYECRVFMAETDSWDLISFIHLKVDPPEPNNITAESGQNVTLTCRAPNNKIRVVWSRADLKDEYVLVYRDGHFDPDNQHPSFKNRVDLQDRQMKDGDVSLTLKDVTISDTGTYECHVFMEETHSWEFISIIIYLHVVRPDEKIITAEPGQDVTLTFQAPNNNITAVKWSRADLEDEYVLFYHDGHFDPDNQHPSFKNRVDLQDRQMKDGDVSLILKDVTINDTGTYECRVTQKSEESMKLRSRRSLIVADQKNITAESGQKNVTLTCRAPNNKIISVEWSRADLRDENVLFYRDGHFVPDDQHPSFKNRVDLKDRQMKDGDVSLILKDVTINDSETYFSRVFMNETRSWKPISIINLKVFVPPDQKNITAESGQDVTLTCRAPNNNITTLKWSRADLGDKNVLLHRDGQSVPDEQHPSFKNRVDLQDRQIKDGKVSLILKDVTINDTGTYECRVFMAETDSWEPISIIHFHVDPPGPPRGILALIVVILLLLVGFLIYRKHKVSRYSYEVSTENNEAPQSPQQDCVRGQTEVNCPEPPADGH
ncbi:kin of IRRE-like protein 1 [Pelmatolapia mariae]|uniref:kin of IRRE-like protein 1 n=1 Tax=Pelmatolapia mariae TaxID=158779 RepID=UPI002FE5AF3E